MESTPQTKGEHTPESNQRLDHRVREAILESNLAKILSKYQRKEFVKQCLVHDDKTRTFAGSDIIFLSAAICPEGTRRDMSAADVESALSAADKIAQLAFEDDWTLTSSLRVIQALRPGWFTGPFYEALLRPFTREIKEMTGFTPPILFREIMAVVDGALPSEQLANFLAEYLTIDIDDVARVANLVPNAMVVIDGQALIMWQRILEATYRYLSRQLRDVAPKYAKRKGQALEKLVAKILEDFAPGWKWFKNPSINGREKDLVGHDHQAAVAVECKSMGFRPTSADWSELNAKRDAKPLWDAVEQCMHATQALRAGCTLETPKHRRLPARPFVQGMVVVDEIYASYARMSSGSKNALDRLDGKRKTADDQVWVGSVIDLAFLCQVSNSMAVLLDFMAAYRNIGSNMATDEPEAWFTYHSQIFAAMATANVTTRITEFPWDRARTEGLDRFRPEWIHDWRKIWVLEGKGRSLEAFKMVYNARKTAEFPNWALDHEDLPEDEKEGLLEMAKDKIQRERQLDQSPEEMENPQPHVPDEFWSHQLTK